MLCKNGTCSVEPDERTYVKNNVLGYCDFCASKRKLLLQSDKTKSSKHNKETLLDELQKKVLSLAETLKEKESCLLLASEEISRLGRSSSAVIEENKCLGRSIAAFIEENKCLKSRLDGEEVQDWSTLQDRAFKITECAVTLPSFTRNGVTKQLDHFVAKGFDCVGNMIAFDAWGPAAAKILARFNRWNDPNVM